MSRNFGIECELAGGTAAVLDNLSIDSLHAYHCGCPRCRPFRDGPDWTAQEDCTADGEIISRVLQYGTGAANFAISNLATALRDGRAVNSDRQGLHVHVSNEGMDGPAWVRFWRLWFRYQDDIADMARGKFSEVRSYNGPVQARHIIGDPGGGLWRRFWTLPAEEIAPTLGAPYGRTCWVNPSTGHDTVEFRLWNATRVGWRIHLAVGVSVALIEAAVAGGESPAREDERSLIDFLHPHLTDESFAAIVRHHAYQMGAAA